MPNPADRRSAALHVADRDSALLSASLTGSSVVTQATAFEPEVRAELLLLTAMVAPSPRVLVVARRSGV
ncbi:hypothetical protein IU428_29020 [Nocardia abscessus]|uniref:hypothetical protein n=1 Tax=Nocardia abscessus TaxID=120957 RepID=UPI0018959F87|nr:hypothetical protein [Nocardia abscessus]MBF6475825.1 hypothetical protein [Nocardia abscessus]